jgi:DNA-binding transcriptional ArsR family regulator
VRRNKTLALILVMVITASFAGLLLKQKNAATANPFSQSASEAPVAIGVPYNLLSLPAYTNYFAVLPQQPAGQTNFVETPVPALGNATRTEIYKFIATNPGVNFRGICDSLGISIGLAQFHLGILSKAGLISFFRDGKYKRFFQSKRFTKKQMQIISLLRHKTAGNILQTLLERREVSHGELAHELSITSQGLTWHMNHLAKEGLVQENLDGMKLIYSLDNDCTPVLTELASLVAQINFTR